MPPQLLDTPFAPGSPPPTLQDQREMMNAVLQFCALDAQQHYFDTLNASADIASGAVPHKPTVMVTSNTQGNTIKVQWSSQGIEVARLPEISRAYRDNPATEFKEPTAPPTLTTLGSCLGGLCVRAVVFMRSPHVTNISHHLVLTPSCGDSWSELVDNDDTSSITMTLRSSTKRLHALLPVMQTEQFGVSIVQHSTRSAPLQESGLIIPSKPGKKPGTPNPFHHRRRASIVQEGNAVQMGIPSTQGWEADGVSSPIELVKIGQKRSTTLALKRKKQLAMDAELARNLQTAFDAEQQQPRCDICGLDVPFDGSVQYLSYCETCNKYSCDRCLSGHIMDQLKRVTSDKLTCPHVGCRAGLLQADIRRALSEQQNNQLEAREVEQAVAGCSDFIHCPCCEVLIEKDESSLEAELAVLHQKAQHSNAVCIDGVEMRIKHATHYTCHRLRCRECHETFCTACLTTPYHLGKLCEEAKSKDVCRFCTTPIETSPPTSWWRRRRWSKTSVPQVCESPECKQKMLECCTAVHPCGHPCNGVAGEKTCLPCLHEDCQARPSGTPAGSEFCSICWIETLSEAPCVQLECGHVVHHRCIVQKLTMRWPTCRITFGFMNCGLCGKEASHPDPKITKLLEPLQHLKKDMHRRWLERLRVERLTNSTKLTDKDSPFYKNPIAFAQHTLCYYQCFRCGKPYYGGAQQCNVEEEANREFKKEELVCGACVDQATCPTHGSGYIGYKCKYCCRPAVWFCFGTTHFCDSCHRSIPQPLVQCKGKESCPLGIDHPPNGQEFSLGCVLCAAPTSPPSSSSSSSCRN